MIYIGASTYDINKKSKIIKIADMWTLSTVFIYIARSLKKSSSLNIAETSLKYMWFQKTRFKI